MRLLLAAALLLALDLSCSASEERFDPVFQKGFTLGGWTSADYSGPEVSTQIERLREAGVEWVALTPRWFQERRSSVSIRPDPELSPTDESVLAAARLARSQGLRVFLKPQIDVLESGFRGDIAFHSEEQWSEWFRSYRAFISHYAELATRVDAALLSVGVELDGTRHRARDWRSVIAAVRELYAGPLVYAANFNRERDIEWWDALDYAGVDAYFPVARGPDPSLPEVERRWRKEVAGLRAWARAIRKPVLLTEIGYRSLAGAGAQPWEWQREGRAAPEEQAVLYRAALSALWSEDWLYGFYWWQWRTFPPADPESDTGFTPQGKPAWDVIREFYAREAHCPMSDCAVDASGFGSPW